MTKENTTKPSRDWVRWTLVISLALNLLVVGALGGWMLKGGKQGHPHPSRLDQIGGPLTRALSKEDRRAIGREMRREYRERGGDRAAQKAMMQDLVAQLRQTPFDRAAVAALLASQREMLGERVELGQSLLVDRLNEMDSQARAAFADRLEAAVQRRGKKRSD